MDSKVRYYVHIEHNNNIIMNSKRTVSLSEARKNIFRISNEAAKPGIYYTLTENGRSKVVIMSAEEFESWQETLEVLEAIPDLDQDIEATEKEIRTGKHKNYIKFEDFLKKSGYEVSTNNKTKGRKGN